ncbi:hypothetical protein BOTBODRAFT_265969 [Botryobasidium botryosum FD-172 SS1]|uniref:Uncharacterized protein n=1 Tax=Botryobasidium botryosum (strain FD-172 SS1) TaxID=930990 RepID=A0A067MWT9_BOTB1|nr:hypothetical protein BOTBODRAFT_265969 [Botryobasidium botryosum FD-172 SS1]
MSDTGCASPTLLSLDAEFPALDEVAAALSACSPTGHLSMMKWMDASGDISMEGDNDNDNDSMLGSSLLAVACPAPAFPPMDVDAAGDTDVDCDESPALQVVISSLFGSRGHLSRLVKRHQRTRARVGHPPHDSMPPPKPNIMVLRLVNKYADLGIDAEATTCIVRTVLH